MSINLKSIKLKIFQPFSHIDTKSITILFIGEIILALIFWNFSITKAFPTPLQTFNTFIDTIVSNDFLENLMSSLGTTFEAMFISMIIALIFSYGYKIPVIRPISVFISKCRYLTLTGLIFLFTMISSSSENLKLNLLVFGMTPFFITSMIAIIKDINKEEYELSYTLKYNKWETLYEVIIVGRLDQVIEIIRQNFAMSWLMITMVEAKNMSGGGLGTMLIIADKYLQVDKMFAILLIILLLGIFFDWFLSFLRYQIFGYLNYSTEKN